MSSILTVGSINADLVVRVDRMPQPGETCRGTHFALYEGGKGANQAVAVASMGVTSRLLARVGDDPNGVQLISQLQARQVIVDRVLITPEAPTGTALIHVDKKGENTITIISGANDLLSRTDVDAHKDLLVAADLILMQLEIDLAVVRYVSRLAHERQIPVVLDPAPAPAQSIHDILPYVYAITPNESEARSLTGVSVKTKAEALQAARQIQAIGARNVILKMGARGALVLQENARYQFIDAFPVTTVDSTAAGDAFNGVMAVALSESKPLEEAVLWGCAAGALATTREGAQESMPSRKEVQELIAARPAEH